jgi:DNA-binding NarL/FixJ family response regulator
MGFDVDRGASLVVRALEGRRETRRFTGTLSSNLRKRPPTDPLLTVEVSPLLQRSTVLLADDHPLMLEGLRKLLEPEFEVIGTATDGPTLLAIAEARRPDLVITDIEMPGLDGIELTRRLCADLPAISVLILSIHAEPSAVRAAFAAGASGYLTKTSAPSEIEQAAREVLRGRFYVSPAVARTALQPAEVNRDPLTPREHEVLRQVARGLGNKEIARRLGVRVTTVRSHLRHVYEKLSLQSRVELALYAAHGEGAVM